jgi:hypothetical protein
LLYFTPIRELRSAFDSYELLALQAKVNKGGLCNGIVLWIDWILDPSASLVVSTEPKGIESGPVDMSSTTHLLYLEEYYVTFMCGKLVNRIETFHCMI